MSLSLLVLEARGGGLMCVVRCSANWHADITFEPVPSDYAILKVHTLPETGGDTLWASYVADISRLR